MRKKQGQKAQHRLGSSGRWRPLKMRQAFAALLITVLSLTAQTMDEAKCTRIAKAVVGLNYERSSPDFPDRAQIWRFEPGGALSAFAAADFRKPVKAKPSGAIWKFGVEDHHCTLKVAAKTKPEHWSAYRLRDVTWAIVTLNAADRHIPDFEDHTGMRMRFCGTGEHCKSSVK